MNAHASTPSPTATIPVTATPPNAPRFPCNRRPLSAAETAEGVAVVRVAEERVASTGTKYLYVRCANATGTVDFRVWSDQMPAWRGITTGTPVRLRAKGKAGMGGVGFEWNCTGVRVVTPADHPVVHETLPALPVSQVQLDLQFMQLRRALSVEAAVLLRRVLETPLRWADGRVEAAMDRYRRWPAAVGHHHACRHGLLWHSVQVTLAALALAQVWAAEGVQLDTDVLILGGLLHDIGKLDELHEGAADGFAPAGRFMTHMGWGIARVSEALTLAEARGAPMSDRQRALTDHLRHIVASHHGQQDWGALCAPVSREAWCLHTADQTSAKVEAVTAAMRSGAAAEPGWVRPLGGWRRDVFYVGDAPPQPSTNGDPTAHLDALLTPVWQARLAAAPSVPEAAGAASAPVRTSAPPAPPQTPTTLAPAADIPPRVLALRLPAPAAPTLTLEPDRAVPTA